MPKPIETLEKELRSMAMDSGASDLRFIKPSQIITAHWVRLKCQFGCKNMGPVIRARLTAPPLRIPAKCGDDTRRLT